MGENENGKQDGDNLDKTADDLGNGSENKEPADTGKDGGSSTDDNNDDDLNDKDKSKSEGNDDDKSQKPNPEADDEPKVRQRSDFIKERLERKKQKEAQKSDDHNDDDEDDDIDPNDKKAFGKVVEEYLRPIVEKDLKAQDDQEVNDFLKENPDFKPYEAKARKYMAHPSRKDVPISEIFFGVAGKDLLKIGAKRAQIAAEEAKKSATGGGTQDLGGSKSISEMSKSEFEAKQAEVRQKLAEKD